MSTVRTDLIERGNILDSIYSRHLPWSGYYMIAYRATAMRQFPVMDDYLDTYCITELFDGDLNEDADTILPIVENWPENCSPSIAFQYGSGEQRPLGPQPIFPQDNQPRFNHAWVWPQKLLDILRQFPARGLSEPVPVSAYVLGEGAYTAEGQWYLLPPPLESQADYVDAQLEELNIGWSSDRRSWPLLLDDCHTLDPAYDVIQYCGLSDEILPGLRSNLNYLIMSERVVDALLSEAPWLVFHPICIASGKAYRSMTRTQRQQFHLSRFTDTKSADYDELTDWRHAHLAQFVEDDEEHPSLSETDAQDLAALLATLRPA